jgi:hypothetical protein
MRIFVESRKMPLNDGLYQVKTKYLCAGFVIEHGMVTACAPILRKNLQHWMTIARRVAYRQAIKD